MDKTLQDLAWRCLPREFREEVKNVAQRYICRALALFGKERQLANKYYDDFINLFGRHNLTSDAEGEEMLTVPRKRVEKIFVGQMEVQKCTLLETIIHCEAAAKTELLYTLFGSKCLPDNVESSEPNVDSLPQNPTENCDNKSHISADCNKPAEPKFKVGDYARYKGDVHKVVATTKDNRCYLNKILGSIDESDLEPYTEPTDFGKEVNFPTKKQSCNFSQETANCDKEFDNILKNGFREHNRLHIAAMMMQGLLANPNNNANLSETVVDALNCADALIAEVEKGNSDGED